MRIGLHLPTIGFVGGIERYAWDLARDLRARGHELVLLHGDERGRDPGPFLEAFDEARPASTPDCAADLDVAYVQRASDVRELSTLGDVPLAIASHDHAHTCPRTYRYLPFSAQPCHRSAGVTCILHGCVVVRDRRPTARVALRPTRPFALRSRLARLALRGPLLACSRYVAGNLVAAGVEPSRVRVVYPVPVEDPRPVVERPTEPRLAVCGQLVRGKGVDLAIEALAHMPPETTLDVIGDGPSRSSLEALARQRAPGRVRFRGYVPPEQVAAAYDAASVVLVPARWPEPFGMTGIEAMRRARPVAAAAHGGIPEWLNDGVGGLLFRPGSARGLAKAATALLADGAVGRQALEWARRCFPREGLVGQLEAILGGLSRRGAGRR